MPKPEEARKAIEDTFRLFIAAAIKDRRMCRVRWTGGDEPGHRLVAAEALDSFLSGLSVHGTMRSHSDGVYNQMIADGLVKDAEPIEPEGVKVDVRIMDEHYWLGDCPNPERWGDPIFQWITDGRQVLPMEVSEIIEAARTSGRLLRIDHNSWNGEGGQKGGMEVRPEDALRVLKGYGEAAAQLGEAPVITIYRRKQ